MAEPLTLGLFLAGLLACIFGGFSVLYALVFGLICFFCYAVSRGHPVRDVLLMIWNGVRTVKNILIVFALIGMMTALWRAGGTIPWLIVYAMDLIDPRFFILFTFLLCSLMSFLIGTSFGTVGTMGVICMTIARALSLNPLWIGGAVLSGIYFGDRCSPMSSSALLVSELTKTDIYGNIGRMFKTAAVPFALTCLLYLLPQSAGGAMDAAQASLQLFRQNFRLPLVVILPAVLILALALFRMNVKIAMLASIAVGAAVCLFAQGMTVPALLRCLIFGYSTGNAKLSALMGGGGLISMARAGAIVMISSSYFGIFNKTNLMDGVNRVVEKLSAHVPPFGTTLITSVFTSMISCNQTLAVMLTYQLNKAEIPDRERLAITLENTVIVAAPLIPWNIAAAMPLTIIEVPAACLLFAFYLYLIPLWNFTAELIRSKRAARAPSA